LGQRHHGGCNTCAPAACAAGCGGAAACASCGLGAACGVAVALSADGFGDALVEDAIAPGSAVMVVELPQDATLTVDGTATTSTSANRVLVTPVLEAGRTYNYTLTAQVMRDGVLQTVSRQVAVRAGEETRVNLELPVATVVAR